MLLHTLRIRAKMNGSSTEPRLQRLTASYLAILTFTSGKGSPIPCELHIIHFLDFGKGKKMGRLYILLIYTTILTILLIH